MIDNARNLTSATLERTDQGNWKLSGPIEARELGPDKLKQFVESSNKLDIKFGEKASIGCSADKKGGGNPYCGSVDKNADFKDDDGVKWHRDGDGWVPTSVDLYVISQSAISQKVSVHLVDTVVTSKDMIVNELEPIVKDTWFLMENIVDRRIKKDLSVWILRMRALVLSWRRNSYAQFGVILVIIPGDSLVSIMLIGILRPLLPARRLSIVRFAVTLKEMGNTILIVCMLFAFKSVKRKGAIVSDINPPQDSALALTVEVPRHDVGVVLHHAQHDLVAGADVSEAEAGRNEIDRLGRRPGENDLLMRLGVDESTHSLSGRLVSLGRRVGEIMQAAVNVRILMLIGVSQAVDDLLRLLGRGRIIEIDQRLAIGALGKDGEIRAYRLDIVGVERRLH